VGTVGEGRSILPKAPDRRTLQRGWGGRTGSYPSGRPSRGGANRSSNIKRSIGNTTRKVALCGVCGGVSAEIALLTSLWQQCCCTVGVDTDRGSGSPDKQAP